MGYFWVVGFIAILHFCTGFAMLKASKKRQLTFRSIHHTVALFLSWPIFFTIITGVAYRLLRMHGFENVKWLRHVHAGYFKLLMPVYPLVVCAIIVVLSISGSYMYISPWLRSTKAEYA